MKLGYFTNQGYIVHGVVHVGAHNGSEIPLYRKMGIEYILAFEPLVDLCNLFNKLYENSTTRCFPIALGSKNDISNFFVTNDGADRQCSSLLEPKPEINNMTGGVKDYIKVLERRFDSFIGMHTEIDINNYDCLVVDTQGSELDVLQGFGKELKSFKYLVIECSKEPLYVGGATASQVVDYLTNLGFKQQTPIPIHEDILFLKDGIHK